MRERGGERKGNNDRERGGGGKLTEIQREIIIIVLYLLIKHPYPEEDSEKFTIRIENASSGVRLIQLFGRILVTLF